MAQNDSIKNPLPPVGEVVNDEYPTASILLRFSVKPNIDVVETKMKQREARHQIVEQAKALGDAVKKETKRQAQLRKAREKKGET